MKNHHYKTNITWTGNTGEGTKDYKAYKRNYTISVDNKQTILGSSDPAFRGDKTRYNPEDLLLSSVSSCHMLWYLHLCTTAGVIVTAYEDKAEGTMTETSDGGGRFTEVILKPVITLKNETMRNRADELHHEANKLCFIANSCNFPILHQAEYKIEEGLI
jgi:organic hydroperoxide reductase OsmC/OhrA